jgi:hypothetical protein
VAPVVGVNQAPTNVFATTEASTVSPPISAPVSSSILAAPKQFGSTPGLENPPTVGDHAALTNVVVADYWSFSICLRSPVVNYPPHPLHLIPSRKQWNHEIPQLVSSFHCLFSAFVDDLQTQDSGSLFANAHNILITGGTFVSHSRGLHKSNIVIINDVFTRSATFTLLPILGMGR